MAFNPELGSTSPAVLLDNAERLDKLVNSDALTVPQKAKHVSRQLSKSIAVC